MERIPKHGDIVLTHDEWTSPAGMRHPARVLIWNDAESEGITWAPDLTWVVRPGTISFDKSSYGLSWVFEDDIEGAKAFRVLVALG